MCDAIHRRSYIGLQTHCPRCGWLIAVMKEKPSPALCPICNYKLATANAVGTLLAQLHQEPIVLWRDAHMNRSETIANYIESLSDDAVKVVGVLMNTHPDLEELAQLVEPFDDMSDDTPNFIKAIIAADPLDSIALSSARQIFMLDAAAYDAEQGGL